MSTEQTLYVVKILLKHISEHPEDAGVVASGALSMLDGAPNVETEHDTKKDKPKAGAQKKSETKSGAPKKKDNFDTGKMIACLRAGWSIAKGADELGVTDQTIRNHMKKEGLTIG